MEKMKALKVLIINDKSDVAYDISVELIPMLSLTLSDLGFAGEFTCLKDVASATQLGRQDLIFLEGGLRKRHSIAMFIKKIFELNSKAIIFFLPMGITEKDGKDCELSVYLFKDYKDEPSYQIISQEDLDKIKYVIETYISYELPCDELFVPLLMFSEKGVKNKCDLIVKELNKNHINFSVVENDNFTDILVHGFMIPEVEKIAKESNLYFWKEWLEVNHKKTLS